MLEQVVRGDIFVHFGETEGGAAASTGSANARLGVHYDARRLDHAAGHQWRQGKQCGGWEAAWVGHARRFANSGWTGDFGETVSPAADEAVITTDVDHLEVAREVLDCLL